MGMCTDLGERELRFDFINLLSHEAEVAIALLRTLAGRLRDALDARAAPG